MTIATPESDDSNTKISDAYISYHPVVSPLYLNCRFSTVKLVIQDKVQELFVFLKFSLDLSPCVASDLLDFVGAWEYMLCALNVR